MSSPNNTNNNSGVQQTWYQKLGDTGKSISQGATDLASKANENIVQPIGQGLTYASTQANKNIVQPIGQSLNKRVGKPIANFLSNVSIPHLPELPPLPNEEQIRTEAFDFLNDSFNQFTHTWHTISSTVIEGNTSTIQEGNVYLKIKPELILGGGSGSASRVSPKNMHRRKRNKTKRQRNTNRK